MPINPQDPELIASKSLASVYSNSTYIIVSPAGTRLVFGEAVHGHAPTYHWAVTMATGDAIDMANKILALAEQTRREMSGNAN